jgi:hypothetical protein
MRRSAHDSEQRRSYAFPMDEIEQKAQLSGLVWAEELFESVSRSEVLTCPEAWPGSFAHARSLAASLPGARAADQERLARIVQRSAAALWDVLLSWSQLPRSASSDPTRR